MRQRNGIGNKQITPTKNTEDIEFKLSMGTFSGRPAEFAYSTNLQDNSQEGIGFTDTPRRQSLASSRCE